MKLDTRDRDLLLAFGYSEHDLFWIEELPEVFKSCQLEEKYYVQFNRRHGYLEFKVTRLEDGLDVTKFWDYPVSPENRERFEAEFVVLANSFKK